MLKNFTHYTAPTLSHLLALLLLPHRRLLTDRTSLLVVDSISAIIDHALPRGIDDYAAVNKNEASRWLAGRRQAMIGDIAARLAKLAALNEICILITSNMVTRITADGGAMLRPALSGHDWDNAISTKVILYRDWLPITDETASSKRAKSARFAQVAKNDGKDVTGEVAQKQLVMFQIDNVSADGAWRTADAATG